MTRKGSPRSHLVELNESRKLPVLVRFWRKVNKDGPVHPKYGQCWVWTGVAEGEYGTFPDDDGKTLRAPKFSYELHVGKVPDNLLVLHHCDNPRCVRPDHLFVGTDADNSLDKVSKGRQTRLGGEKNGRAKLTEEQVKEIRRLYRKGDLVYGINALARRLDVSSFAVGRIVRGEGWINIDDSPEMSGDLFGE